MPRPLRPRGSLTYKKPALTYDDLVGRLTDRGLDIPDADRARRYLRHIGYYRISPYMIPFQQGRPDHLFREGTAFDNVLDLYVFDRALRLLVMDALERVEVAVRAALTDHMSTKYADPHWYMDVAHFRDDHMHAGFLDIVRRLCDGRLRGTPEAGEDSLVHRSALEHYLTTYGSPDLPPSWLILESLTIGQLTSTYRNLGLRADKTAVATSIGLTTPLLESWMLSYVRARNICAHHGRLWNVGGSGIHRDASRRSSRGALGRRRLHHPPPCCSVPAGPGVHRCVSVVRQRAQGCLARAQDDCRPKGRRDGPANRGSVAESPRCQDAEKGDWGGAYTDHGLVFAREDGLPLYPTVVTHRFASIVAETSVHTSSGLAPLRMIRLCDLRHGAASLGIAAGVPIEVASKRLGHSSISVTADIYGHLFEGVGHQAAEAAAALVPRRQSAEVIEPSTATLF